ncbi:SRPBCC family protein [Pseudalkalibacillus salsuginis]|uniref:SRPBCC family protein n=1 Tax=Pseudalkalibacillus salsuginis TaxID=2910972 RepID=UPI001F1CC617|nr:SRPBCC family protein [Pseudalkalibacillus salsuginis]MCF6409918.1 SRPBCC family protein [Pseudalkalibacillus salsuginis]
MALSNTRTLSISIDCSVNKAYSFISNPENLPQWSFFESVKKVNDQWIAETVDGQMNIRFVDQNEFGILDHFVTPSPEESIMVPMRVIPNGTGCEVIFTIFQEPMMSDEQFNQDVFQVQKDLDTLKQLLEDTSFV